MILYASANRTPKNLNRYAAVAVVFVHARASLHHDQDDPEIVGLEQCLRRHALWPRFVRLKRRDLRLQIELLTESTAGFKIFDFRVHRSSRITLSDAVRSNR